MSQVECRLFKTGMKPRSLAREVQNANYYLDGIIKHSPEMRFQIGETMRWFIFALLFSQSIYSSPQKIFSKIGEYSDVDSDDDGEHCDGTSISLWKTNDTNLVGLIDIHSGLCGDPPCSLIRGKYKNKRLEFQATDSIWGEIYSFEGSIKRGHLKGKLNLDSINLKKEKEKYASEWEKDMASWCKFWSKVPRCQGVKNICGNTSEMYHN
jgi:hypothetical protein